MSHEIKDNVHLIYGKIDTCPSGSEYGCLHIDGVPIVDLIEDIVDNVVTVRYWISNKELRTVEAADEQTLEQVYGVLDAEIHHRHSDLTGYLWTDEHFKVGGHDLIPILEAEENYYLLMEVTVHEVTN